MAQDFPVIPSRKRVADCTIPSSSLIVGFDHLLQVDTLLVGHGAGDIPSSLLQAPDLPAASPYLSLFGLSGFSGAAAGASGMKGGRKNLGRASLVDTS
jgi:hypothetical protein